MKRLLSLFASTAPGLEPFAEAELRALGVEKTRAVPGGVELSTDRAGMFRLLIGLRTVSHLLIRVESFRADRFDRLERGVRDIDWSQWLVPGVPRALRATAEKSRLYHTGAITERVARWIGEVLGDAESNDEKKEDAITVAVRVVHDEVTFSIDLSGQPLHRRGYRLDPGRAPLREDIAAALVIASGWDRTTPLIDPMCGSGTIAIEAALLGSNIAPGIARSFAVERTKLGAPADIERARRAARAEQIDTPRIYASDREPRAAERTRQNAARAGVTIHVEAAALSSVSTEGLVGTSPVVVTNPPWGERLGEQGAGFDRLYGSLGAFIGRLGKGARLAVLAYDPRLARSVGRPLRSAFLTDSGGMKVRALVSE